MIAGSGARRARAQRVGVAAAADDLEAGVGEQAREAVAQQRLVVGDHYPHGSSTTRPSRSAFSSRRARRRGHRDRGARRERPAATAREPPSATGADRPDVGARRTAPVTTRYAVGLDRGGEALGGRGHVDDARAAAVSASSSTAGRAPHRRARVGRRRARPRAARRAPRARPRAAASSSPARRSPALRASSIAERERGEPLLGAVVEVALEPAALGVAGLDDPRAESRNALSRAPTPRGALVLEREPGRLGQRACERRVVEQAGAMACHGEHASLCHQPGVLAPRGSLH